MKAMLRGHQAGLLRPPLPSSSSGAVRFQRQNQFQPPSLHHLQLNPNFRQSRRNLFS